MSERPRYAVIAAAGRGTRFGDGSKVLADIGGRPCLRLVLDAVEAALGEHRQLVVVGHEAECVMSAIGPADHRVFVPQAEQRGTGHALATALAHVDAADADVYFLCGDKPLLRGATLARLRAAFEAQPDGMAFLTGQVDGDPSTSRQGRVVRWEGHPLAIVEHRALAALEDDLALPDGLGAVHRFTRGDLLALREVNVSTYAWRLADLRRLVPALSTDAAQAEVLVTDLARLFVADGRAVRALPLDDPREGLGIDTPEQWRAVAALAEAMGVV